MPRKSRIHYRHAFYHVMLRGNYRQEIFGDTIDRKVFYKIIANSIVSFSYRVHLFCLMTNHIHLVIEVTDIPLSRIMQCICSGYACFYNKKYKKSGHLFQGRYLSKIIQDDGYLLELCYYIHKNPLKAGICKLLDAYPWSSHLAYCNKQIVPWLTTDHINALLKRQINAKKNHYLQFIANRETIYTEPAYCSFDNEGNLIIKDSVTKKMKNRPLLILEGIELHKIVRVICEHLGVTLKDITSECQNQRTALARSMIAYFAHYHGKYTLQDIASVLCRQPDSLSKTLKRYIRKSQQCSHTRNIMNTLETKLSVSNLDISLL